MTSSAENKAVFLSYASQDAEAARRICDALRAAGVEVWFDQSELRGGDAWDQKIRKQIKECALFVPVISANTQARREGYFRIEWKLAAQRTHAIAEGTPFLLPILLGDVGETDALVPTEFREVQWMRIAGGEDGEAFCARVKSLVAETSASVFSTQAREASALRKPAHRIPALAWIAAVAAVIAIAAFITFKPKPNAGAETRRPASAQATAKSPTAPRLGPKSIAVLPFENRSDDKDTNAFFADGVHEDVITNLLLIRELRCVPRTTVMSYRDAKKSPRQIAEELGVAYVLTGTVRRADKKVRITSTLLDARTDEPVWSKPYDKDLSDQFAIQSELAQAIAGELKAALSPNEKKLVERRPTENAAAYDLFLKARELRNSGNSEISNMQKREDLLQAAVVLDPGFAVAWGELARVHSQAYGNNVDRTEARLAKAKTAVSAAQHLAPDSPEVMINVGYYYYFCFRDYPRAIEQMEKAARLQPHDPAPRYALANVYTRQGRWAEALEGFRVAAQVDPANLEYAARLAVNAKAVRRWDEALAEHRRISVLRSPATERPGFLAHFPFWARGSTSELEAVIAGQSETERRSPAGIADARALALMRGNLAEFVRLSSAVPTARLTSELIIATALVALGDRAGGRARLEPLNAGLRRRTELEPENAVAWSDVAVVEAVLGNNANALAAAQKAVELLPATDDAREAPRSRADLAFVLAWTGDAAVALSEYARVLRTPLPSGGRIDTVNVHVMRHHPFFFPLQHDPRFQALLNDPKNNAPLF